MTKNEFRSVAESVESILGCDARNELREQISRRRLVKALTSLRVSKGITQSEIADLLECGQSRISKLENGVDENLTVAEIEGYARASGSEVTLLISKGGRSLADQIKYHACMIREAFLKLTELAQKDSEIARGVAELHVQAFRNINRFLQQTSESLPMNGKEGNPHIKIEILTDEIERHGNSEVGTEGDACAHV